tara:strand:- start:1743 stop:2279 length:537 start_codon:yes stop_codon:yes gene_type:complete
VIKNKAVFLDRDGVINKSLIRNGKGYAPLKFEDFKLYKGVEVACRNLKRKNYKIIIITNQPDVEKGKISYLQLNKMHNYLKKKIRYDDIYVSTSISKKNYYRKPNPGMIIKAIKKNMIDIKLSYFIGDRKIDIDCAKKVACKSIFIDRNYKEKKPKEQVFTTKSLNKAANYIIENEKN